VIPISMPPLRERKEDIPLFLAHFAGQFAPGQNIVFSPELVRRLMSYGWPGNVRELENLVERLIVMRHSNVVDETSWPEGAAPVALGRNPAGEHASMSLHEAEKELILRALEKSGWNKSEAARILDVPRHVLLYRLKTYGLEKRPESDTS